MIIKKIAQIRPRSGTHGVTCTFREHGIAHDGRTGLSTRVVSLPPRVIRRIRARTSRSRSGESPGTSVDDPRLEHARFAPDDGQARHARHAIDAVTGAELAGRAD